MKNLKSPTELLGIIFRIFLGVVISSCGGKNHDAAPIDGNQYAGQFAANIMPVSVGNCGLNAYANEPCVSVKICAPGTTQCQTIPNVLLDTGSYGLRIFSSEIKVSLNQVTSASGDPIAECAQFGTSNTWGPIETADVVLGDEPSVQIPIQVIDASFKTLPKSCATPSASATETGYNGILGVGVLTHDCGDNCVKDATAGIYYTCTSTSCTSTTQPLDKQVINPIAKLPADNNGVILDLPSVPSGGVANLNGTLTIGIGTRDNNKPGSQKVFAADQSGNFQTQFQSQTYPQSFIDSGSNGLFFPQPKGLATCQLNSAQDGFYCPTATASFSATQSGSDVVTSADVSFEVANADSLMANFQAPVGVFSNLAGTQSASFDWGLPFFFGRRVYVGLESQVSSLATGPYWAW